MLRDWGHDKGGDFTTLVWQAVTDARVFAQFRRDPRYVAVVETLWPETGRAYLERIRDARVRTLCLQSQAADEVGGPIAADYEGVRLAPTTLRYGKVLSDLVAVFPQVAAIEDFVEIGVGHGGQARLIALYAASAGTALKSYTCVDLLPVLLLARQYLEHFRLGAEFRFRSKLELPHDAHWGLAISNYAFSELERSLQEEYLDRVLRRADAGYVTMNSGLTDATWRSHGCLTAEELCAALPNAALLEEDPLTAPENYILVYGRHEARGIALDELRRRAGTRAAAAPARKSPRLLGRIGPRAR